MAVDAFSESNQTWAWDNKLHYHWAAYQLEVCDYLDILDYQDIINLSRLR